MRFDPKTLMKDYDGSNVVEPILDSSGKPERDESGAIVCSPPITLGDLLKLAFARYRPANERESIEAYGLAKRVFVKDGELIEFSVEEVAALKRIGGALHASPLHYGQLCDMLENQHLPAPAVEE